MCLIFVSQAPSQETNQIYRLSEMIREAGHTKMQDACSLSCAYVTKMHQQVYHCQLLYFFFYISHFFLPFLSLPLLIIILHAPSSSSSLSLFLYFFLTSYPVLKTLLISLYCIHTPHYASHNREILSATRCEQGNTESKMPRFVQPATNRVNFEKENCRRAIGLSVYLCYVFFFLSLSLRLLLLRKNYDVLLLSGMLK